MQLTGGQETRKSGNRVAQFAKDPLLSRRADLRVKITRGRWLDSSAGKVELISANASSVVWWMRARACSRTQLSKAGKGKEVGEEWNLSRKYLSSSASTGTRYLYHPISMYLCIYMHTFPLLADNFSESSKNSPISAVVEHSTSSFQSKASVYAHKRDRNFLMQSLYIQ